MYKITVNDKFQYEIESKSNQLEVNGVALPLDFSQINSTETHVLYNNKSYNTEVVEIDRQTKTCKIKVNGNIYQINVEDQFDQLLKQMGLDTLNSSKVSEIKAPMPGLVLNIVTVEGAEVKKGDSILILEAMKMENILKSPADGIIKKILVTTGDKVEKNQLLVQFK